MTGKKLIWATVGVILCWTVVPTFLSCFWGFQDFFQDWASARNWVEGIAIYSPHSETVPRYLGLDFQHLGDNTLYPIVATVKVNAHPPSSVLFYLPFSVLPYRLSFVMWNLVSGVCLALAAVILYRELDLAPSRRVFALLAVLGFANGPMFEQMFFAQSNAVTLLLVILAWQAHRRGWQVWEGCCLGAAIALKLYPLVLLVVPLAGRRWRSIGAALTTVSCLVGLSLALFGWDTWKDFAQIGMPEALAWSDLWANASLSAFWQKLFLSQNRGIPVPLSCPAAYRIFYGLSWVVLGLATVWLALRERAPISDHSYSVATFAMLVLSPTCWPHYFLLAILPLALLWRDCREMNWSRRMLVGCFCLLFVPAGWYQKCCLLLCSPSFAAGPFLCLTFLSMQTYAMVGLWVLAGMAKLGRIGRPQVGAVGDAPPTGERILAA